MEKSWKKKEEEKNERLSLVDTGGISWHLESIRDKDNNSIALVKSNGIPAFMAFFFSFQRNLFDRIINYRQSYWIIFAWHLENYNVDKDNWHFSWTIKPKQRKLHNSRKCILDAIKPNQARPTAVEFGIYSKRKTIKFTLCRIIQEREKRQTWLDYNFLSFCAFILLNWTTKNYMNDCEICRAFVWHTFSWTQQTKQNENKKTRIATLY